MPVPAKAPLDKIIDICDELYARDGFVKWIDVGNALGVSRQAIQLRLRAAVEKGELTPERVEQWQSMTSRAAATREREKQAKDKRNSVRRLQITATLTQENAAWLRKETVFKRATTSDIINGLITKARIQ